MDTSSNTEQFMFYVLIIVSALTFIVLVSAVYFFFKNKKKESKEKGIYQLKPLLTQNEKDCFKHLKSLFPEYHICPQVSMGAVLDPVTEEKEPSQEERTRMLVLRNKISSKMIDFVFLDKNLNASFIVELDDKSHDNKVEQDAQRDQHLRLAGLPTVRFRREKGSFPNRKEIETLLKQQNK